MAPSKSSKAAAAAAAAHNPLPDYNPFASGKPALAKPQRQKPTIVASGNSQKSNKPPPPVLAPGELPPPPPLFPAGYKTPLSLLQERCQKAGWDKPAVNPHKLAASGGAGELWTASVILRRKQPKTGETETVHMRPPAGPGGVSVEKPTAMEAKHFAAVYALFRFSNNLRLNLQLPPQTRGEWPAATSEHQPRPKVA